MEHNSSRASIFNVDIKMRKMDARSLKKLQMKPRILSKQNSTMQVQPQQGRGRPFIPLAG